ncbi:hypothetical protein HDU76_009426, partial [Blyttiomyces sp. JEL0837]
MAMEFFGLVLKEKDIGMTSSDGEREMIEIHFIGAETLEEAGMWELEKLTDKKGAPRLIEDDKMDAMGKRSYDSFLRRCREREQEFLVKMVKTKKDKNGGSGGGNGNNIPSALKYGTSKPDLVMVLNSGIHEHPFPSTWGQTIKEMIDLDVPVVFTSYNEEEVQLNEEVLKSQREHHRISLASQKDGTTTVSEESKDESGEDAVSEESDDDAASVESDDESDDDSVSFSDVNNESDDSSSDGNSDEGESDVDETNDSKVHDDGIWDNKFVKGNASKLPKFADIKKKLNFDKLGESYQASVLGIFGFNSWENFFWSILKDLLITNTTGIMITRLFVNRHGCWGYGHFVLPFLGSFGYLQTLKKIHKKGQFLVQYQLETLIWAIGRNANEVVRYFVGLLFVDDIGDAKITVKAGCLVWGQLTFQHLATKQ